MMDLGKPETTPSEVIAGEAAVIRFKTTRFGEREVHEDKLINFQYGMLGFPKSKRFVIIDYEQDVPFKWLQSVDEPAVAFVVMDPRLLGTEYLLSLKKGDIADLGEGSEEEMVVLVILTIPEGNPQGMTANLRGPVLVNSATRLGKQLVLENSSYPVRQPVFK